MFVLKNKMFILKNKKKSNTIIKTHIKLFNKIILNKKFANTR